MHEYGEWLSAKLLQSYPTLCDPTDCSPLGSSVHGILQAGTLEWVAMPPPGDLPMCTVPTQVLFLEVALEITICIWTNHNLLHTEPNLILVKMETLLYYSSILFSILYATFIIYKLYLCNAFKMWC